MRVLGNDSRKVQLPLKLRKIVIDIDKHQSLIIESEAIFFLCLNYLFTKKEINYVIKYSLQKYQFRFIKNLRLFV